VPLGDGSALRLTTSKYFTPLGKEIHGKGVLPDIVVEEGKIEVLAKEEQAVEKPEDIFQDLEKKEKKVPDEKSQDYKTDNQLMQAVDVLKAIKIYKGLKENR
jgi:carboxyl-terminal processing protease